MGKHARLGPLDRYVHPIKVLSLIHQQDADGGVFTETVVERGHELDERCVPEGDPVPSLDGYGAMLVFGGSANVDEEDRRPWLRTERRLLERVVEAGTPILGVCLGAQQLASVGGALVRPLDTPEIGWREVVATDGAEADPVLGPLPRPMCACEWHGYTFEVPPRGVGLFHNDRGCQAFRLGDQRWGIQFHAEVTRRTIERWIGSDRGRDEARAAGVDPDAMRAATDRHIDRWNEIGRGICGRFLDVAERR